jgi:hypothetical protein
MKTRLSSLALFILFLLVSLSRVASAQDNTLPVAYSGVAKGTGGSVGGKTISFDFRRVGIRKKTDKGVRDESSPTRSHCSVDNRRFLCDESNDWL